uniref:Uncharacterized protein n=1 Tax=Sander lucioperca TaxID=283035 RepID=A0A8C9ZKL5_SANLU
ETVFFACNWDMKSLWNCGSMTCIMSNSLSGPLHVCRGGENKGRTFLLYWSVLFQLIKYNKYRL